MEIKTDIKMRPYEALDYKMLKAWWKIHDAQPFPESIIPPSSLIVEDAKGPAAFTSVFLCNSNPVAFCHGLVTRPGMNLGDSIMINEALQDGIDILMRQSGHSVLFGTVSGKGMQRAAKRMGFQVGERIAHDVMRQIQQTTTQ